MTLPGRELLDRVARQNPLPDFVRNHWSGSFAEYLDIVRETPRVTRNAHERLYDMILSHGTDEIMVYKERTTRYRFFDDPIGGGRDE